MKIRNYFGIAFLSIGLLSCDKKSSSDEETSTSQTIALPTTPSFNQDTAYEYVSKQVSFGNRVPNSPTHVKCGNYLIKTFKEMGLQVEIQEFTATAFDGKVLQLRNIIAKFNPTASKRLIYCAHWDTRPFADQDSAQYHNTPIDGANDGASGVGILLEVARTLQLAKIKPSVGIDFVLFDGEDYGQPEFSKLPRKDDSYCLGSQYWAKEMVKNNYKAYFGILLDMVGAPNAHFAKEGVSRYYAGEIVNKIWDHASRSGYSSYFVNQDSPEITDDHFYVNSITKIPMVDIIDYDPSHGSYFGHYWHTRKDNMNAIDKNTLKAVGQTLLIVAYSNEF